MGTIVVVVASTHKLVMATTLLLAAGRVVLSRVVLGNALDHVSCEDVQWGPIMPRLN
jgi:hypothetical protein